LYIFFPGKIIQPSGFFILELYNKRGQNYTIPLPPFEDDSSLRRSKMGPAAAEIDWMM
jgi:hypothetical protein